MDEIFLKRDYCSILEERFSKQKEYISIDDILDEMDSMSYEISELNDRIYELEHADEIAYDRWVDERIDEQIMERLENEGK